MAVLLRAETAYFDEHEFDPVGGAGMYYDLPPMERKLAHIGLHVGNIAMGKLVMFRTINSMSLMHEQIIPDLALYATQLANIFEFTDDEIQPTGKLPPFNFQRIDDQVRLAGAAFTRYIEPLQHGVKPADKQPFITAARQMWQSAMEFGVEYGRPDITAAQLERMQQKLGHKIPGRQSRSSKLQAIA